MPDALTNSQRLFRQAQTSTFDEAITQLYSYDDQTTDGFAKRVTSSSSSDRAVLFFGLDGELGEIPPEPAEDEEQEEFVGQLLLSGRGADFYEKVTVRFTEGPGSSSGGVSNADGSYERRESGRSTNNTSVGYGAGSGASHKSSSTGGRQGSGGYSGDASSGSEKQQGQSSVSDSAKSKSQPNGAVGSSSGFSRGAQRSQSSGDNAGGGGRVGGSGSSGDNGTASSTPHP